MATGNRTRELATLRLSGATQGQVLRMIGVEAYLVASIGTLLAAGVTALTVISVRYGLRGAAPAVHVVVSGLPIGAIALACLLIALLASLIPAGLTLRRRPAGLAGRPSEPRKCTSASTQRRASAALLTNDLVKPAPQDPRAQIRRRLLSAPAPFLAGCQLWHPQIPH